ncbi:MAG: ECF transporter S component [Clostridia bacterium]|nr:ECF transporter S component [Clostridia bacterium]
MQTNLNSHKVLSAHTLTRAGILAGISVILMMVLEFPIPFMPPFLKVDFSNVPVLIGSFAFGPAMGFVIVLIKDLIHLLNTKTGGIGELADFLTAISLALPASLIYKKHKSRKGAILGMLAGIVAMTLVGTLANKFILIPFYSKMMPLEKILELCGKANPLINSTTTYLIYGVAPFNIIKASIISLFTMVLYKRISNVIHAK